MGSLCTKCKSVDLSNDKSNLCCLKVAGEHVATSSITCDLAGGHSINICASRDIDIQDFFSDTDDIDMAVKCGCINDICGLVDTKFMIQVGVCYAELKSLSDNVSCSQ